MNQNRLFVGNLSYQTMDHDLQDYFSQAGVVTSVSVMMDKVTGKSRGFAFVEFATGEEAAKAVEQFHGKDFQGRALTVNVARPREEHAPRWSGQKGAAQRGIALTPEPTLLALIDAVALARWGDAVCGFQLFNLNSVRRGKAVETAQRVVRPGANEKRPWKCETCWLCSEQNRRSLV